MIKTLILLHKLFSKGIKRNIIIKFGSNIYLSIKRLFMSEENKKIEEFLSTAPLYNEMKTPFGQKESFFNRKFDFFCKNCDAKKSFILSYDEMSRPRPNRAFTGSTISAGSETQLFQGTCQHCRNYNIDMVLKFRTAVEKSVDHPPIDVFFVEKIGQNPKFNLAPPKYISKFLDSAEYDMYKNSKVCFYQGYGIASFIYLRRTVEDVAKRKLKEFCTEEKYNELMKEYESNKVMDKLLSAMNEYLPASIKNIGGNPFTILYDKLSNGIHRNTEEECKAQADDIFNVFETTIKKFYEDQTEINSMKQALSSLTKT